MPSPEKLDTHHKALTLNLDASAFGSFAEIGAGQEVSHWFFLVGGASATVAKTVSAYDKEVSDDLYGSGSRYVSRQRLEAMLDKEWAELLAQLGKTRGHPLHKEVSDDLYGSGSRYVSRQRWRPCWTRNGPNFWRS